MYIYNFASILYLKTIADSLVAFNSAFIIPEKEQELLVLIEISTVVVLDIN